MKIKIIDVITNKGTLLKNRVLKAVEGTNNKVSIVLINDKQETKKLKLKSYPALIINDNLESEGRIISTREIIKILKRYEQV